MNLAKSVFQTEACTIKGNILMRSKNDVTLASEVEYQNVNRLCHSGA